jgi:hypothetical protein
MLRILSKIFIWRTIFRDLIEHVLSILVESVLCVMFTLSLSTIIENNNAS